MLFKKEKKKSFIPGMIMGVIAGIGVASVIFLLCDEKKTACLCSNVKRMLSSVKMQKKK